MVFIVVAIVSKDTDLTQHINKRHYNMHLVNNVRETDICFIEVLVAMMCEDPEEHKLIRNAKF